MDCSPFFANFRGWGGRFSVLPWSRYWCERTNILVPYGIPRTFFQVISVLKKLVLHAKACCAMTILIDLILLIFFALTNVSFSLKFRNIIIFYFLLAPPPQFFFSTYAHDPCTNACSLLHSVLIINFLDKTLTNLLNVLVHIVYVHIKRTRRVK